VKGRQSWKLSPSHAALACGHSSALWPRAAGALAVLAFTVAAAEVALAQCRLYRNHASATGACESICASVSCNTPNDSLVGGGPGPQTTKNQPGECVKGVAVVRTGDTACEACGFACDSEDRSRQGTVDVEVTCMAT